jgi:hypothetical protein
MATQDCILRYSGKLGNRIGYRRGKGYFQRSAPAFVKQTAATKRAARDFGTASTCSRIIRHALREDLQHCHDSSLNNRLNKVFGEIIRADIHHEIGQRIPIAANMDALLGFQFNKETNMQQFITASPLIEKSDNDRISISLPQITINNSKALRDITHLTVKAIALSVNFRQEITRQVISETLVVKRGKIHAPMVLELNMEDEKDLTFIMLEIQSFYEVNGQLYASQNKKGHSLDIVAILPPVEQLQAAKREYRNKAPRCWGVLPYPTPVRKSGIVLHSASCSLPEG